MQRFFSDKVSASNFVIYIKDQAELYHQMTRVLRMQVGESCIFFNGCGLDWVYQVESIDKKSIALKYTEQIQKPKSTAPRVYLFQSIPNKLEKLEYLIQKGVEVGIDAFIFFEAARSQKLPILDKKKDRLLQIAVEAVEQSGGDSIPEMIFVKDLAAALTQYQANYPEAQILVAHTDGHGSSLRDIPTKDAALFVGPEGGFSPEEVAYFADQKGLFLNLGSRILRTETAGVVTAFAIKQS